MLFLRRRNRIDSYGHTSGRVECDNQMGKGRKERRKGENVERDNTHTTH